MVGVRIELRFLYAYSDMARASIRNTAIGELADVLGVQETALTLFELYAEDGSGLLKLDADLVDPDAWGKMAELRSLVASGAPVLFDKKALFYLDREFIPRGRGLIECASTNRSA